MHSTAVRGVRYALLWFSMPVWAAACAVPEARTLDGRALHRPALPPAVLDGRLAALRDAEAELLASPDSLDALIWVGRRQAYLSRYRDAIATYDRGLRVHGEHPRLLRHRGHRWLTLRALDAARSDLQRATALIEGQADRVEADGLPNARGIPTSTLHTNIHYHLGLACFLQGDYAAAEAAYRRCLAVAANPDMWCATAYWLCLTLWRQGGDAVDLLRSVDADFDVIENHAYHELLLVFAGKRAVDTVLAGVEEGSGDFATRAFGVAEWLHRRGDPAAARDLLRRICAGDSWASFGHIAAEARLLETGVR